MSEYKLHVAIIDHLRGQKRVGREIIKSNQPFPGLFVSHIYQGRSKEEGFFLKSMGVVAGMPDILAIWKDGWGFLEVKTENGKLSTAQKRFMWFCQERNINWALVRSVAEAHNKFKNWGLKPIHEAIQEPDLRSWSQKRDDAIDAFRP